MKVELVPDVDVPELELVLVCVPGWTDRTAVGETRGACRPLTAVMGGRRWLT